ncbi:MAG: nitroreductase [Fibrobacter sp.]|nr:nitroreductase [Fibrobacter sp.]
MKFSVPVKALVKRRFSCRSFLNQPLEITEIDSINSLLSQIHSGPLGSSLRFKFITLSREKSDELKVLGTYGAIKNPAGYLAGVADSSKKNLEDYGFVLEKVILHLTDMGLGTCWLGGLFTRSSFAKVLGMTDDEMMPAIVALGKMADPERARKALIRQLGGSYKRKPIQEIFFSNDFHTTITAEDAGSFTPLMEMVQWAPSAANKQPWRIIKKGDVWHFYLNRTKGYSTGLVAKLVKMDDIQRLDIGIAMCHWELGANEIGLQGRWIVDSPDIEVPSNLTEYVVSWKCD